MATTFVARTGKRVSLSIQDKARLLLTNGHIIDIGEAGLLAVRSASDPETAYAVYHDGKQSTGCACKHCKATGNKGGCSYRQAVDWKLQSDRRNVYVELFGIYEIYG